ncbi:uncharacterized protein AMSG_11726 [Thecamonas trahens ATCC 50062]|uniref:VCBS repeat-containing protein n=1 Tax=Thecamonas trahens ATCC 50062 TaxID=461836 RepID=A0A0L0D5K6_THETB|nr:hypothetical protein AMSG_11726 [Thecamonas trahens ATCC 50062]KNC47624.1 hypothetical protein AMSG_11726 [Thecamonas trahens ATCC 50062]|eukprot:XP_013759570.1 hypothetical protein AMSG_11726 [Thecamonas trahens ATCC 50062]
MLIAYRVPFKAGTGVIVDDNLSLSDSEPGQVVFGDVNEDGRNDIVAVDDAGRILIYLRLEGAGYRPPRVASIGSYNTASRIGFALRNGAPVIVFVDSNNNNRVSLMQSLFESTTIQSVMMPTGSVKALDWGLVTGDSLLDFVVVDNDGIKFVPSTSVYTFSPPVLALATTDVVDVVFADVDDDADLDIIAAGKSSKKVIWFPNSGSEPAFSEPSLSFDLANLASTPTWL